MVALGAALQGTWRLQVELKRAKLYSTTWHDVQVGYTWQQQQGGGMVATLDAPLTEAESGRRLLRLQGQAGTVKAALASDKLSFKVVSPAAVAAAAVEGQTGTVTGYCTLDFDGPLVRGRAHGGVAH